MERFTVLVIPDERSKVRRYQVPKRWAAIAVGTTLAVVFAVLAGAIDYRRVRQDVVELDALRSETEEQRAQIQAFAEKLADLDGALSRIRAFERKVRVIADLPGGEIAPDGEPGLGGGTPAEDAADPQTPNPAGRGGGEDSWREFHADTGLGNLEQMAIQVDRAAFIAGQQSASLEDLIEQLHDKANQLASTPSIRPTRGWISSTFGTRISPFTGRRERHMGLDIATEPGKPIIAPADGRVVFVGRKGPLGKTVIVDHGYGVRTLYGHTATIHVKKGDTVARGELIAAVGSTGRSTGPHLHYVVEVKGKSVDPMHYILD